MLHIDFQELDKETIVCLRVPVVATNAMECVGVKLGGMLRPVMRRVRIRCLPKDIPSCFEVDVKDVDINQSKRIKDLTIPPGVTCLANANDVLISIAKK